jgi:predicted PilT family ATPase
LHHIKQKVVGLDQQQNKLNKMTRDELKEKIKVLVKQVYKPEDSKIDLDSSESISLDSDKFPILLQYPSLKDAIDTTINQPI